MLVRIEGRGTLRESPTFQEQVQQLLAAQAESLTVDLSCCQYLDSTFLGCLAGLHKRFNRAGAVRFQVGDTLEHAQKLFAATRLHTLLPLVSPPQFEGESSCVVLNPAGKREVGRLSVESHRQLAELGGPEERVFRAIADQLERELGS